MLNKFLLIYTISMSNFAYAENCVPAHEYFPFDGSWVSKNDNGDIVLGMYSRVSPDGRYVLRSFSGKGLSQVTLMELEKGEKNKVKLYETPMKNEAFPVQGSWRYLVDVGGEHYKITDLLTKQKKAKKVFKGGISGFYTVAAELPGGKAEEHRIRSLAWPSGNSENQGVGVLSNRVIKVQMSNNGKVSLVDNGDINYMCKNLNSTDGSVMSLPMISMDATEFASMPQNPKGSDVSMRIYKFGTDDKSCEKVLDLNVLAAKIIFSRPEQNFALFYASGAMGVKGNGVYFFDRISKQSFGLDDIDKRVQADSFPGFTNDGRIVYGAYWQDCNEGKCVDKAGYVVSDPYQAPSVVEFKKENPESSKHLKSCITIEEMNNNSREQEKIWSYKL